MANNRPSQDVGAPTKKRTGPVFMPKLKRRTKAAPVRRTHSPKNAQSPRSVAMKPPPHSTPMNTLLPQTSNGTIIQVPPTVTGVQEGVRAMCRSRKRLAVPTETVYMVCTSMNALKDTKRGNSDVTGTALEALNQVHSTLVLESAKKLDSLLPFPKSSYAMRLPQGKATPPIRINESRQVLQKLAQKYWPGVLPIYLCVDTSGNGECCSIPPSLLQSAPFQRGNDSNDDNNKRRNYLPLVCPSHPLLGRVLTEVSAHYKNDNVVVVGTPTAFTCAQDVCDNSNTMENEELHVLLGEDQREHFSVPTCQYGRTCNVSLWINDTERIVYIVGSKEETMVSITPESIQKTLLKMSNPKSM